jgi:hypothetical protein
VCLLFISNGVCQVSTKNNNADDRVRGITYRKEMTFDLKLHTNGFAFAYNSGDIRTYYRTNYYELGIGTMHNPRELKQTKNTTIVNGELPKDFKFGKQNSVFIIRGSKGIKKYLTDKAKRKGVELGYNLSFGPSIAVLKPYYLKFVNQAIVLGELKKSLTEERYSETTKKDFEDYNKIYGGASFFKGIKELSFTPGVQSKLGLFFSLGSFDEYVKAGEVGIMADIYTKKIPIMIEHPGITNSPYFINLYVNLHLGKRSN